jgi:hypothetical protein
MNSGVQKGAPVVVEVLNFPQLLPGTTYEVKLANIPNPTTTAVLTADLGIRIYIEDIATGNRTYSHYDTFTVTLDLSADSAPTLNSGDSTSAIAFEAGEKVGRSDTSYLTHSVWDSNTVLSGGDIFITVVPSYLNIGYSSEPTSFTSTLSG